MMAEILHLSLIGAMLMITWMIVLWAFHFPLRNAAILDLGWASGLGFLSILYACLGSGDSTRRMLIATIVCVWSFRLTLHLLVDRIIGKPEDPRYAEFRAKWKTHVGLKFLGFFIFQGLLDVLLAIPFLLMSINSRQGLSLYEWIGVGIWLIAIIGESVSDHQLKQFKRESTNHGKTCQKGLWHYSRHPNYFFEWMVWIGYFVAALGSPWGWASFFCPLLMLYFLLRVTGIPMTERQAIKSRGEEYRRYQRTTSMFVPWFPKISSVEER